jgi:hypothetical protein
VLSAFRIDNDNKRVKTPEASSNLSTRSNKTTTTNN